MNTHTTNYGQSVKTRLLNLAKQENIRMANKLILGIIFLSFAN